MRWSSAHVGNVAQKPDEGQDAVNTELKVPEAEPTIEEQEAAAAEAAKAEEKTSATTTKTSTSSTSTSTTAPKS